MEEYDNLNIKSKTTQFLPMSNKGLRRFTQNAQPLAQARG
jgi:hypothetical protein